MPIFKTEHFQPWINTAFRPNGTLKPAYLDRLKKVLKAADDLGMVCIIGFYYFGQDELLENEKAVITGVENGMGWLMDTVFQNILVEINNESNIPLYQHEILCPPRVHELIDRAKKISKGKILVSTSFTNGMGPTDEVLKVEDFVLIHGNSLTPDGLTKLVQSVRANALFRDRPQPVVFNEDSVDVKNLDAAFAEYCSWGYYDQGNGNDYQEGFQSPPVNWGINTETKRRFFNRVAEITGMAP